MSEQIFADRLKAAMQLKHFKQIDLVNAAEAAGIKLGKSHVSQYVSGKTVPRDATLSFLAKILECDKEWLKNGLKQGKARMKHGEALILKDRAERERPEPVSADVTQRNF